jgi:hypothetical protein
MPINESQSTSEPPTRPRAPSLLGDAHLSSHDSELETENIRLIQDVGLEDMRWEESVEWVDQLLTNGVLADKDR